MTFKTKKRTGEVRLMQNKQHIDEILQRRARLTNTLKGLFLSNQVPASWIAEIVRMEGLNYV